MHPHAPSSAAARIEGAICCSKCLLEKRQMPSKTALALAISQKPKCTPKMRKSLCNAINTSVAIWSSLVTLERRLRKWLQRIPKRLKASTCQATKGWNSNGNCVKKSLRVGMLLEQHLVHCEGDAATEKDPKEHAIRLPASPQHPKSPNAMVANKCGYSLATQPAQMRKRPIQ